MLTCAPANHPQNLFPIMAIFRCNKCAHLDERPDGQLGESIACPSCGNSAPVYSTQFFVAKLLDRYFAGQREISRLKALVAGISDELPAVTPEPAALTEVDFFNTDSLASDVQHGPIYDWFKRRQITVQANMRGVDTTGFFDEVAVSIGSNLNLLSEVVERIRWAQQKEYSSTTISLEKKAAEDTQAISIFCQQLYDFSFIAKCIHNRQKNNLLLVLQTAPAIRDFFNGEWLEWYALMTCLQYAKERKKRFSCARNLKVTLHNEGNYELDVFMLLDCNTAICIECKTGEFRQNIDKYLTLRKRLGLSGKNFVMCITGLSEEHAKGLTAMYDLAFVNEQNLAAHLARLF